MLSKMVAPAGAKADVSDEVSESGAKAKRRGLHCYQGNYTVLFARLAIMTLMAVAICLTTLVTFYWTQRSSMDAVRGLGFSLRYDLLDRSVRLMNATLNDQTAVLEVAGTAVHSQYRTTGHFFGTELDWKTWPLVSNKNHVRNFGLVLENGLYQYTYNQNTTGGPRHFRTFANASAAPLQPETSYIEALDKNGNPMGPAQLFDSNIDFRQRAYYVLARKGSADSVFISLLFSIQSYPVLLVAAPLKNNVTNETLGVYTIATTLDDLSAYISGLDLKGGSLYFKTMDNILVAAANSSSDFKFNTLGALKFVNQSDSALIRATDAFISKTYHSDLLMTSPVGNSDVDLMGSLYYVDTLPLSNFNLQVVAVLMIPRQSIMGPIDERRGQTILLLVGLSCAIFAIGCVLVFCLTTRVSTEVRLKAELGEAKARAEANSEAKSRFLSNMSHELRTPMAGILGLLDILLTDELSPENLVNILQIRQCATGLLGLLNNLLDLGKIEAGKVDLEWADFDLIGELESLVDMFSVQCNQKGIEIGLDLAKNMQRVVKGDQARIRQVFANLLSNAIKFSSQGGQIVVRGRPVEDPSPSRPSFDSPLLVSSAKPTFLRRIFRRTVSHRGDSEPPKQWREKIRCAFEVDDTGLGIPPEKRELVFENFVQADSSTTRLHGGTGLGLGIVRSLVGMMGGEIRVHDKAGPGTLMGFTVCFERASEVRHSMRFNPADLPLRTSFPRGTRVVLGIPGDLSRQIAARFIRDQDLEVQETQDWAGVLALLNQHREESLGGSTKRPSHNPASNGEAAHDAATAGHVGADVRPRESVAIDMDILEAGEGQLNGENADPPALLVVLDIQVTPPDEDGQGLERCFAQLQRCAPGAVIAWLVSTETPASTRQVLKALSAGGSALLATKPVYGSRLHSLLEAMSERLDSLSWNDVSGHEIVPSSGHVGRAADVSADVAPRVEVGESSGAAYGKGGARMWPLKTDTSVGVLSAVENDVAHGIGFENAQRVSPNDTNSRTGQAESLSRAPETPDGQQIPGGAVTPDGKLTPGREAAPVKVNSEGIPLTAAKKERKSAKAELQELGPALAGMRILVAEDTPILQKLAVAMLQRLGAEVTAVGDGQQAVDIFTKHYGTAGNGTARNGNGTAGNGTAENGTAGNGTAENGTAGNGRAENGTVGGNGTAGNGTDENGTAGDGTAGNGKVGGNGTVGGSGVVGGTGTAGNGTAGENGTGGNGTTGNGTMNGNGTGKNGTAGNRTADTDLPFTCVLMDCQMPVMDGYDTTRAIRLIELASGQHTPIVALTAHAMASDQNKCLEAGMDGYLSKPINPTLLVSTLRSVAHWPSILD